MPSPKPLNLNIEEIKRLKSLGHSAQQISRILKCCGPSVLRCAKRAGITFTTLKNRSNIEQFLHITNPVIAYFLGYLWADGYLIGRKSRIGGNERLYQGVAIQLLKDDGEHLYSLVKGLMDIRPKYYNRVYSDGSKRRPQIYLTISDSVFARWLVDSCGYNKKSGGSMAKMMNNIPAEYQPAFWLGYFDGDGTIDLKSKVVSFASTYNQDWSTLTNLCESLGIEAVLRQWISKKGHRASSIRLKKKKGTILFVEYLSPMKHLALARKWDKFDTILRQEKKNQLKKDEKKEAITFIRANRASMSSQQLADALNLPLNRTKYLKDRYSKLSQYSAE